ncbi:hypothetical protein [Fimbriimonas ginsengisoli]|uniref:Uncharacterized protein n=1 Tax=Fimbriimonas ginsengisoli Gsoil 348 TaxID=661478 RepID=A0A068NQV3_FIMGI|nr:hypothetical protein [Fimbriimonas ginsengisoli]AIE85928.1 hypothetical protein OP10G_2560 [Fimbriimonas ginsengisoli Gsoil 348]
MSAQSYQLHEINDGIPYSANPNPFSINSQGKIVIQTYPDSGPQLAYLFEDGVTAQIAGQPNDQFFGINNSGTLVGYGDNGGFVQSSSGVQTLIQNPAGDLPFPSNISNSGVVVGTVFPSSGDFYGFTWKNGQFTPHVLPGTYGSLNGVNSSGTLVGTYYAPDDFSQYYGFIERNGVVSPLVIANCINPTPITINDRGVIVGSANQSAFPHTIGFVRNPSGSTTLIDYASSAPQTMPGPSGPMPLLWYSNDTIVYSVNNRGQIVGRFRGTYSDGVNHVSVIIPFIGDPVQHP